MVKPFPPSSSSGGVLWKSPHFRQPSRRGRTEPSLLFSASGARRPAVGNPDLSRDLDSCPRPTHSFVGHRAERTKN